MSLQVLVRSNTPVMLLPLAQLTLPPEELPPKILGQNPVGQPLNCAHAAPAKSKNPSARISFTILCN